MKFAVVTAHNADEKSVKSSRSARRQLAHIFYLLATATAALVESKRAEAKAHYDRAAEVLAARLGGVEVTTAPPPHAPFLRTRVRHTHTLTHTDSSARACARAHPNWRSRVRDAPAFARVRTNACAHVLKRSRAHPGSLTRSTRARVS
eukprot:6030216-Pleurochrysis_carterae.AAC.1